MTQVDEEAQDAEVFRGRDVFTDESTPAVAVLAAGLGKAVTRQIDQEKGKAPLPFFFIATPQGGLEIVDGLGLPRRAADPGQAAVAAEGIDQARLADVRAAEKGHFRKIVRRILIAADSRCRILGLNDVERGHQDFTSA